MLLVIVLYFLKFLLVFLFHYCFNFIYYFLCLRELNAVYLLSSQSEITLKITLQWIKTTANSKIENYNIWWFRKVEQTSSRSFWFSGLGNPSWNFRFFDSIKILRNQWAILQTMSISSELMSYAYFKITKILRETRLVIDCISKT